MKKSFQSALALLVFLFGWQVLAFSDVSWDTAIYRAITYVSEKGIISGYDDGSFGVHDPVNKAAALKVILTAAEVDIADEFAIPERFYTDVAEDDWYTKYIVAALNEGILSIDPEDENPEFHPANEVNRAAFIKMMLSTFGVSPEKFALEDVEVVDVPEEAWFAPYMKFSVKFNVVTLNENGEALPGQVITRGETVQYLYETLKQGKGLSPQTLLMLTENHLVQTIEKIEANQFPGAGLAVDIAEKFIELTVKMLPDNNIVQSAHKTVLSVKSLVGAYAAGEMGRVDDVLVNTGAACTLASEAGELNPGQATMTDAIKHLAHGLAAKTREVKEKVEEEKARIASEGGSMETVDEEESQARLMQEALGKNESDAPETTREASPEAPEEAVVETPEPAIEPKATEPEEPLSEEEQLLKQLEAIRAKKEAAKKQAEEETKKQTAEELKEKAAEEAEAKKAAAALEAKQKAEAEAKAAEAAAAEKAAAEAAAQKVAADAEKAAEVESFEASAPAAATSETASATQNAVIKAQLATLTPVLTLIEETDPMKAIVSAQLGALEQVLVQPSFNKDLVLAQLGALEPVINALQNEGLKNIVIAQLGALKQVVISL